MVPKAKKEAPAPLKAEAKAKALRPRKQCWKASTATSKRSGGHQPSNGPKHCSSGGSPSILGRAPLGETQLTTTPSSDSPSPPSQPWRKQRAGHTVVHDGCQGQTAPNYTGYEEAPWHWHGWGHTLSRPDGEKKAYVWLAPDHAALDVANKIGII